MYRCFILYRKDFKEFPQRLNYKTKKMEEKIPFFISGSCDDSYIPRRMAVMNRIIEWNVEFNGAKKEDFIIKELNDNNLTNSIEVEGYLTWQRLLRGCRITVDILVRRMQEGNKEGQAWSRISPFDFM